MIEDVLKKISLSEEQAKSIRADGDERASAIRQRADNEAKEKKESGENEARARLNGALEKAKNDAEKQGTIYVEVNIQWRKRLYVMAQYMDALKIVLLLITSLLTQ